MYMYTRTCMSEYKWCSSEHVTANMYVCWIIRMMHFYYLTHRSTSDLSLLTSEVFSRSRSRRCWSLGCGFIVSVPLWLWLAPLPINCHQGKYGHLHLGVTPQYITSPQLLNSTHSHSQPLSNLRYHKSDRFLTTAERLTWTTCPYGHVNYKHLVQPE